MRRTEERMENTYADPLLSPAVVVIGAPITTVSPSIDTL